MNRCGRVLVGAVCVSFTSVLGAQSLGGFGSGETAGADVLVEREPTVARIEASFAQAMSLAIDAAMQRSDTEPMLGPEERAEVVEDFRERFSDELATVFVELEADGLLTFAEVSEAVPPVRQRHLARFEDVLQARSVDSQPPPEPEAATSTIDYVVSMGRYILVTRNGAYEYARLAIAVMAGLGLAMLASRQLARLARRSDRRRRLALARAASDIRVPLLLVFGTGGLLIGLNSLWLPSTFHSILTALLRSAIVVFLFWATWRLCVEAGVLVARLVERATGQSLRGQGELIVQRILRLLALVVFAAIVTRLVAEASLTGIIAGLGIIGVGLWFLMQGLIENLAASFTLFGDDAFRINDVIIYDGEWGTIETIGFRSTRFRTFDGHLLTIPNKLLIEDAVQNVSARPFFRRRFRVGIVYRSSPGDVETALDIVRTILEERRERLFPGEAPEVVFEEFGSYELQLLVQYHVDTTDYWEAQHFHSDVNREMLKRFDEAGIEFALPTQTTLLGSAERDAPALSVVSERGRSWRASDREGREGADPTERTDATGDTRREGARAPVDVEAAPDDGDGGGDDAGGAGDDGEGR